MSIIKARPIAFSEKNVQAIQALFKTQTRRVIIPQPWRDNLPHIPGAWMWWMWSPKKRATGMAYTEMMREGYHRMAWAEGVRNPVELECFSPYAPGDHLWVKETWRISGLMYDETPIIQYKADGAEREGDPVDRTWDEDKYLEWCQRQWGYMATDCAKAGIEADTNGIFRWTKETNPNRWHSSRFMPRWASRLTLEVVSRRAEQLQHITARECFAEGVRGLLPPFDEQSPSAVGRIINDFAGILRWGFVSLWNASNAQRGFEFDVNPWVWVAEFVLLD